MGTEFRMFDAVQGEMARGIALVEASAGTGKTYAITMLVLRAVVEARVPIDRILVVTFTKAATEELRLRIRSRLVEARDILAGQSGLSPVMDETLSAWIKTLVERSMTLALLQRALADIDRLGVFTIHGFCQRMLAEQALESGQLFDVELLADIRRVRMEVAEDFWRDKVYSLAPVPCGVVIKEFPTPEQLFASVYGAGKDVHRIEPLVPPAGDVLSRLDGAVGQLIDHWTTSGKELERLFAESVAAGHFNKKFTEGFDRWFTGLTDFFGGAVSSLPDRLDLLTRRELEDNLHGSRIRGIDKQRIYFDSWPLPEKEVEAVQESADLLLLTLRVELAEKIRAEVGARLDKRSNIGFDDLVIRLSRALEGERGRALKRLLGGRYEVALIDEFQDTDAAQWHIFSSIFGSGEHSLYLIGDPKQAIYAFRGADIHSYFAARKSAGKLLTLERNYRSHPHLVSEVNRLFSSRIRPFFYPAEVLNYRPVQAAKKDTDMDLQCGQRSLAGMVYCTLPANRDDQHGRWSSGEASRRFRTFVVAETGRLLDPLSRAMVRTDRDRPLAPHDIAVLVRSHRQAEEYRQALVQAGIPATVASRISVFKTDECRDLLVLLQALAMPGDHGKMLTALSIPWFGLTGNDIHELTQDDRRLHARHSRFLGYHQLWCEQGLLPMMSGLLAREEVFATLGRTELAERSIVNIIHLLELSQEEESCQNLGVHQVVQWLSRMTRDDSGSENSELLLESDEEAVRIVTMHGAKGLEYPVVFCPFLWYASNRLSKEQHQVSVHDDYGRTIVDLGSERFGERRNHAVEEQKAEDLRLLYVALTRAKISCYAMWADVKSHGTVADSFESPLGYLLFPDGFCSPADQESTLLALQQHASVQVLTLTDEQPPPTVSKRKAARELRPLAPSSRSLYTDWQMSSYSAMATLSEYEQEKELEPGSGGRSVPVPGLPAGAGFGNVVHDLLDGLDFADIAAGKAEQGLFHQKCLRYGIKADSDDLARLLQQVVTTPLPAAQGGENFSLAMVEQHRCLKEMGFYFQLGVLTTPAVNEILAGEQTVVPLGHRSMRGYLTGSIDLVCQSGGKFYILDYKTNFLGDTLADYRPDRLLTAMQSHNYGLQYWIYTVVLHRYLQKFLDGYDYREHFGGVRYLFVRGMTRDIAGSGVFTALPDYQKVLALGRTVGGEEND